MRQGAEYQMLSARKQGRCTPTQKRMHCPISKSHTTQIRHRDSDVQHLSRARTDQL